MRNQNFIRVTTKGNLAAEMYRQEQAVAMHLAKHCATLITMLNGGIETDWRTIYEAAHVHMAEERHKDQQ